MQRRDLGVNPTDDSNEDWLSGHGDDGVCDVEMVFSESSDAVQDDSDETWGN